MVLPSQGLRETGWENLSPQPPTGMRLKKLDLRYIESSYTILVDGVVYFRLTFLHSVDLTKAKERAWQYIKTLFHYCNLSIYANN